MPLEDTSKQMCFIVKTKCFIVLTIILTQNKTKKSFPYSLIHYLAFIYSSTIADTKLKRFRGGLFEVEMLEIFTSTFLLKTIV